MYILGEDEDMLLECIETFKGKQDDRSRNSRGCWMMCGPT